MRSMTISKPCWTGTFSVAEPQFTYLLSGHGSVKPRALNTTPMEPATHGEKEEVGGSENIILNV